MQQAYGEDTEIYKTLNPKHSQVQIKPQSERHRESKLFIEQKIGKDLFNTLYEMLEIMIQDKTDHRERQKNIKDICNGNKELIKLCDKLEEIIFFEQNFIYA